MRLFTLLTAFALTLAVGCADDPATKPGNNVANNGNNGNNGGCNAPDSGGANECPSNNGGTNNGNNGGTDPEIFVSAYDTSCEFDSGCRPVHEGNVCDTCGCPNAGVATADAEQYGTDYSALAAACPDGIPNVACDCIDAMAICTSAQTCAVAETVYRQASEFDQSCVTTLDCTMVPQGNVCQGCTCDYGVINVEALDDYNAVADTIDCNPEPADCACAPIGVPTCDNGTCVLAPE